MHVAMQLTLCVVFIGFILSLSQHLHVVWVKGVHNDPGPAPRLPWDGLFAHQGHPCLTWHIRKSLFIDVLPGEYIARI